MSDPFQAAGDLGEAYRQVDWATTSLGPVTAWSPTLRAAVNLMVRSKIGATLLWGPDFVLLYNEAYIPILAEKHPSALGRPARDVFPEVWQDIEPLLRSVFTGQGTVGIENFRLMMNRHHMLQESYFTFSYSAVAADDGPIEGVLDIVTETTAQVIGHRRLALLSRLTARLADLDLDSPQAFLDRALPVLRSATDDLAAVDIHLPGAVAPATIDDEKTLSLTLAADKPHDEGRLIVRPSEHVPIDVGYHEFVGLVAATLERGLNRIRARQGERRAATLERQMSETLQRSLLTAPIQPNHLQVAVRYQPAAEQAQVGGDWYDSFLLPDGCLNVVVGDVTGHDQNSAAAMAQIRNLTRGVSFTLQKTPALVLSSLDAAMSGLAVNVHATVVLAQIEQTADQAQRGMRTLRWSNAGHPPPILLHVDGTAEVLHTPPETLLGTRLTVRRSDHTAELEPGSSVVFYTDGLVERRHTGLDEGTAKLVTMLSGRQNLTAEQVCDLLLERFGYTTEDDIVLTVIHAYPEDGPRSAEAGPEVLPNDLTTDR